MKYGMVALYASKLNSFSAAMAFLCSAESTWGPNDHIWLRCWLVGD